MATITGRVKITVDGVALLNKSGASASGIGISGDTAVERKPVTGDTGLHGYTEEVVPAELEVTITDRDDISLSDLARIAGDGTVVLSSANGGKSYTMANAVCAGNFKLTAGEGETSIKFFGSSWVENPS